MALANPAICVARRTERERAHTQKPGSGNGKCQSDRGQVIGGKLLIGQLAPWVTWDIWH